MKITNEILNAQVKNINAHLPITLVLNYAYGGVKLCRKVGEGVADISSRMSNREMSEMLEVMYTTIMACEQN